jgi:hypothetical protein
VVCSGEHASAFEEAVNLFDGSVDSKVRAYGQGKGSFAACALTLTLTVGDDTLCVQWLEFRTPSQAAPAWVEYRFTSPHTLTQYVLVAGNDSPHRDPASWRLEGQVAAGGPWTELESNPRPPSSLGARLQRSSFVVKQPRVCAAVRLVVTATTGASNCVQVRYPVPLAPTTERERVVLRLRQRS